MDLEVATEVDVAVRPTAAFCVRLSGAARVALVDAGLAVVRALTGRVIYAEPPTGWDEEGCWCIRGISCWLISREWR